MTGPLASTRHYGRYRTATPQRALYYVEAWPSHTWPLLNLWPFHFRNGYGVAVSEVKLPVSEVKPPTECRSGQKKVRWKSKKVMDRTVFQGDHDGRGLVSQNPGPCFFNAIKAGAWPVPEATDIKTAARWPKSPGRGQPAGWGAPLGALGGD